MSQNFHTFGPRKKYPQFCTFKSEGKVQKAAVQWFRWQLNEFFTDGKNQLVL